MKGKLIVKMGKQYRISSSLLFLFSMPFIVWQMGVLFFSGTTMSLFGRTPIPLTQGDTTLAIAAGYVISIIAIYLFPRRTILMERILLPIALISTILMLFPFSEAVITVLFLITVFACVFSIGTMLSLAVHQFTVGSTWRDGIISMVFGGMLIAILQNDFFKMDFTVFAVLAIVLIAMQTVFYYLIPVKIEVDYVSRENKIKMPKILFAGIWLIIGFSTLLICFASSYAESAKNGVSIFYLSAAFMAVILYFLRKRLGIGSLRVFGVFFAVAVFGFVLAFLSVYVSQLRIIACIFFGCVLVLANLWIFFASVSFRAYPTRFIGVMGAAVGIGAVLIHSGLLDMLRDNTALLYGIYAALSVALLIIYYLMEPFFTYAWTKRADMDGNDKYNDQPVGEDIYSGDIDNISDPLAVLSEQERILATMILAGHTETSASRLMNITINTQKSYRKNIYAKLDIHSKRELFEIVKGK